MFQNVQKTCSEGLKTDFFDQINYKKRREALYAYFTCKNRNSHSFILFISSKATYCIFI